VKSGDAIGYKMPVCSRDFGLYAALLMGALVYPIVRELKDRRVPPPVFFLLALVPIALDGGLQLGTILLSSMGTIDFVYESTNVLRLITGVIAGFAASFYAIPLLMNMFGGPRSR
jgi:uncharacterized membrane protein